MDTEERVIQATAQLKRQGVKFTDDRPSKGLIADASRLKTVGIKTLGKLDLLKTTKTIAAYIVPTAWGRRDATPFPQRRAYLARTRQLSLGGREGGFLVSPPSLHTSGEV